jgi:hypothetical protein
MYWIISKRNWKIETGNWIKPERALSVWQNVFPSFQYQVSVFSKSPIGNWKYSMFLSSSCLTGLKQ